MTAHLVALTEYERLDLILKLSGGCAAIVAFAIGVWQYARSQRWQRANVILSLISLFEEDKRIASARLMLDWDEREFDHVDGTRVAFRNDILANALRVTEMDTWKIFNEEERAIRDAFDAFFDYFSKLYAFISVGVITLRDCRFFYYWLELITDIGHYKKSVAIQKAIHTFIVEYRFVGVQELLELYGRQRERLAIMRSPSPIEMADP